MTRCLVTGGAGFIGSNLVDALLAAGHSVVVLDDFSTGRMQNLVGALDSIDLHVANLESLQQVRKAVNGCEVVFHLAASSSVAESLRNPYLAHSNNVTGTVNLLDAVRESSVRKVVFASSAAIYGSSPVMPVTETMRPQPINPYGLSKHMCEQYLEMYAGLFNFDIACMRFFNVYGPRQNPNSEYSGVISKFLNQYMTDVTPKVFGDGLQSRDFVYVDDIVQALMLAMVPTEQRFATYNVCTSESHTLLDLLTFLSLELDKKLAPKFMPARPNDIHQSVGSSTKIRRALGFQPRFSFREGLKRLIESVQADQQRSAKLQPAKVMTPRMALTLLPAMGESSISQSASPAR